MTTPTVVGDPQILGVSNQVQPLVGPLGQGSQITIVNFDLTGKMYVGYSPSITAGGPDTVVIPPLGSAVISASRRTFIVSNTATPISGQLIPGAAQWTASPADIATQISQAGIPSIDVPTQLSIIIAHTVAAGATYAPGHITVSKFQSWTAKMFCTATASGLGTSPNTQFEMRWSIANDNFDPLINHDWTVPNTPNGVFFNYINEGEGPVFGDTLDPVWINNDTQPVNVTFALFGSYRQRIKPKFTGRYHWTGSGAPDYTKGIGSDNIVEIYAPATPLAAGSASASEIMNMLEGPAMVSGGIQYTAAGVANFQVEFNFPPSNFFSIVVPVRTTAVLNEVVAFPPTPIILPRRYGTITLLNSASSASAINSAIILVTSQVQPE